MYVSPVLEVTHPHQSSLKTIGVSDLVVMVKVRVRAFVSTVLKSIAVPVRVCAHEKERGERRSWRAGLCNM